jgi:hypothetical protein
MGSARRDLVVGGWSVRTQTTVPRLSGGNKLIILSPSNPIIFTMIAGATPKGTVFHIEIDGVDWT